VHTSKLSYLFPVAILLLACGFSYQIYIRYIPVRTQFSPPPASSSVVPARIRLPAVGIDLPVFPVDISPGRWPANRLGVSYVASSPVPGQVGNSIFYGHDYRYLLGNLYRSKPGQAVSVSFSDGKKVDFVIQKIDTVSADDVRILAPSDKKELTLYTCTGFLDLQRLVVKAYSL
jgi:sortase A